MILLFLFGCLMWNSVSEVATLSKTELNLKHEKSKSQKTNWNPWLRKKTVVDLNNWSKAWFVDTLLLLHLSPHFGDNYCFTHLAANKWPSVPWFCEGRLIDLSCTGYKSESSKKQWKELVTSLRRWRGAACCLQLFIQQLAAVAPSCFITSCVLSTISNKTVVKIMTAVLLRRHIIDREN